MNRNTIDADLFARKVKDGVTVRELTVLFGVSRQAVSQRAIALGLRGSIKSPTRASKPAKLSASFLRYGIPDEVIRPLIECGATRAFTIQRRNANARGIHWDLTFADWWAIWSSSGLWEQRGRTSGRAVMARNGDTGPYAKGNVFICTQNQNMRDANRWRRESATKELTEANSYVI